MSNESNKSGAESTSVPYKNEGSYPAGLDAPCVGRRSRALGEHFDLRRFGVNRVELAVGAWSSQRHWHTHEDELIYVLSGELSLVTNDGEQTLSPGMVAGFAAGVADGHHLVNRGAEPAIYLEIGDRNSSDCCHYPDVDLFYAPADEGRKFQHKDGTLY